MSNNPSLQMPRSVLASIVLVSLTQLDSEVQNLITQRVQLS